MKRVFLFLAFATVVLGGPIQWTIASGGNGNYYEVVAAPGGITWDAASAAANALGHYSLEPELAIPALAACLVSRTNPRVPFAAEDDPHYRPVAWRLSDGPASFKFCLGNRRTFHFYRLGQWRT